MKNIVLLSDGTGNGAAKKNKTNIWRLYVALDMHEQNQIAMYDDGVGSKDSVFFKVLGGVFGVGLKHNVLEMYKYLCRNYRTAEENQQDLAQADPAATIAAEGADQIYLFGFSRGAFTVRVLAGLINHAGLCTQFETEDELDKMAADNYRAYRQRYHHGYLHRLYCTLFVTTPKPIRHASPEIKFIGVWDTVDAYVFPIDELSILWDFFVYPIRFPDQNLSHKVKHACHALAVDDERLTFHPVMWNEAEEKNNRIEQVWFPGVHSDVGGGYPRASLSLLSLDWMLTKVEADDTKNGLVFIKDIREQYHLQSDWNAPQHNSRAGLGAYYRYKPRNITQICHDNSAAVTIKLPKIHQSVFERIRGRATPYAPTGIPADYDVVATGGPPRDYEPGDQKSQRFAALNFALDSIYWRRWLYFAFVGVTLALVLSRFYLDWQKDGSCVGSACAIGPVWQYALSSLPDFAAGWIEALRQNPSWLWGLVGLFAVLFTLSSYFWKLTRRHAMCAWAMLKRKKHPPKWTGSLTSRLRQLAAGTLKVIVNWSIATLLFVIILYLLLAAMNASIFHLRYTFGTLCMNSNTASIVTAPKTVTFASSNACFATGIQLEQGKTYHFDVADTVLHDGKQYTTNPDGFTAAALYPFVPFRRHIGEPWLKLHGKIDNGGYETFGLGKGTSDYTAKTNGELFLYVNDAVFGVLPEWDMPYTWKNGANSGEVVVTVSKPATQ